MYQNIAIGTVVDGEITLSVRDISMHDRDQYPLVPSLFERPMIMREGTYQSPTVGPLTDKQKETIRLLLSLPLSVYPSSYGTLRTYMRSILGGYSEGYFALLWV